jgi:hypothetical protein
LFGNIVVHASKSKTPPLGRRSTLVTNRTDNSANDNVACELLNTRETSAARHDQVVLNDVGSSRHDIIDPTTFPQARTLVYPKLEAIVLRPKAGSARKKQFALSRLRARVRSTTEFGTPLSPPKSNGV